MSILVIGGSGYIGSRLVENLVVQDIPTTIWDLNQPPLPLLKKVQFVQKDFINVVSSDLVDFDTVVLLAGVSSVRASQANPALAVRANIEGLVQLFSVIGDKLLIYASSGSVYDGCGKYLASEDTPLSQPRNIYDFSKQAGDEIAAIYGRRWFGLRFGTVNGVSPNMRTDLVVNRMTLTASQKRFVEIANPHAYRAILCIEDLATFISSLVQKSPSGSYSGILNLGSFNVTIGDLGNQIADQMKVPIKNLPSSNTYDFSMSTIKARSMFGFEPVGTLEHLTMSLSAYWAQEA